MIFREVPASSATRVFPETEPGDRLSFREFFAGLERDAAFREAFAAYLRKRPEEALFWETPPCTLGSVDQPFEFVCVPAPSLAMCQPNPRSFADQFLLTGEDEAAIVFENLGGDATLVVPRPEPEGVDFTHLLAFLRHATPEQIDALLHKAGALFPTLLGHEPRWVSTAGMGVPWLHLRYDTKPKYYRFTEYRNPAWAG